jgi:acyl carrier protein
MQAKDEILEQIRASLAELFELDPVSITLASRLYEDLEIDSIDAVDLMDGLRRHTGKKMTAEDFRSVRTVGDLVEAVYRLVQA